MLRYVTGFWILAFIGLIIAGCQRNAAGSSSPGQETAVATSSPERAVTSVTILTAATVTNTPRPTHTPSPTEPSLSTSTPTATRTPATTNTPTQTPTITLTPTLTPIPSDRLAAAQRTYHNGLYSEARLGFEKVLQTTGTLITDEVRLALFWRGRSELALAEYNIARATFDGFIRQYPDDELTAAAHFNQALALEMLGQYDEAIAAYQASLREATPIATYIYERMGDFALAQERFSDAAEWYAAGIAQTDDRSFQVHLREGLAAAYLGQERLDESIAQYDAIMEVSQIPAYQAKITRLKAEAYLTANQPDQAQQTFQRALDDYPDAYDSYLGLIQMVENNMPVDEFQRGYTDYYGGNAYQPAIRAMERYLATNPATKGDEALWVIAFSQRALGDYGAAIRTFERLIHQYPESERWVEANLQRARTLGWQGNSAEAIRSYRDFAANHPDSPDSPDALWRAALLELRAGQLEAAFLNFHGVAQQHPASQFADDALYWAGVAAFRDNNFAEAEQTWSALLKNYPSSKFAIEAGYWQAKALFNLDQPEAAKTHLQRLVNQPYNYYALRARDILAVEEAQAAPTTEQSLNFSPPTPQEQLEAETWLAGWLGLTTTHSLATLDRQIAASPTFIRAEWLHKFGLMSEAEKEYNQLLQTWGDNTLARYQLALHFKERGFYHLSMRSIQEVAWRSPAITPAEVPRFIRHMMYPIYYADLIIPRATELGLDPALVFALIRQESFYNPNALSIADARGLMQVIPPTAAEIAEQTQTPGYTLESLWRPHRNVEFGTWYIYRMLNFFDGDRFAALAAYNAGPGNVQRWRAGQPTDLDLDLFVAQIPLTEPQTYIHRIYVNLAQYQEIYR